MSDRPHDEDHDPAAEEWAAHDAPSASGPADDEVDIPDLADYAQPTRRQDALPLSELMTGADDDTGSLAETKPVEGGYPLRRPVAGADDDWAAPTPAAGQEPVVAVDVTGPLPPPDPAPPPRKPRPPRHMRPARQRIEARRRRESALYLPWWTLLVLVGAVAFFAAVIMLGVTLFGGGGAVEETPVVIVVTSTATRAATTPPPTATPTVDLASPTPAPAQSETPAGTGAETTEADEGAGDPAGSDPASGPGATEAAASAEPPTPIPVPIAIGVTVEVFDVGAGGLNVRPGAGVSFGPPVFTANEGTQFEIIDGPQEADGFTWWRVLEIDGQDRQGWAAGDFLRVVADS